MTTTITKDQLDFQGIRLCTTALGKSEQGTFANTLQVLNGYVTATDGHRLCRHKLQSNALKDGYYVPITNNQKQIMLESINRPLRFPNEDQIKYVIEHKPLYAATVNRKEFLSALKKMAILKTSHYVGMGMIFSKDKLRMYIVNPDLGDAETSVPIKYDGIKLEIGFNVQYCIDMIKWMKSDILELGLTHAESPMFITGNKDERFIGLIMPMRI